MNGHEHYWFFGYWWIFPLVMMFFCFLFMRGWSGRRWLGKGHLDMVGAGGILGAE